ncbi:MAG: hypothetical protein IPO29_19920 [Anaerolineae bacterium]|nr:hypothetical protein [Anaerolineae bacterium]
MARRPPWPAARREHPASVQEFLRGLGYQGLGESSINALGAPAFGVLTGLGEMSRLNRMISPEFGPMVRVFKLLMDLPVAVDKPIDAGIMAFCKACKKCAEACPSQSLSFDTEPTWKVRGPWNNPGHKAYFEDSVSCMTYWREKATKLWHLLRCPFAKKDKAWIHEMVKVGMSVAPSPTASSAAWTTPSGMAPRQAANRGGISICRNTALTAISPWERYKSWHNKLLPRETTSRSASARGMCMSSGCCGLVDRFPGAEPPLASAQELEPRAAMVFWVSAAGVAGWRGDRFPARPKVTD